MARPPQSHVEARGLAIMRELGNGLAQGVEVGVFAGDLSGWLLREHRGLKLYMVDPWRPAWEGSDYARSCDPHANCTAEEHEEYFREACAKVEEFGDRAVVLRIDSEEASKMFGDEALDFVFLDGDHTEKAVHMDIEMWWPKVKVGGWIGGHDYANPGIDGVKLAVDRWAEGRGLKIGDNFTWFVRKPA